MVVCPDQWMHVLVISVVGEASSLDSASLLGAASGEVSLLSLVLDDLMLILPPLRP